MGADEPPEPFKHASLAVVRCVSEMRQCCIVARP
jgi:hypothetical protein